MTRIHFSSTRPRIGIFTQWGNNVGGGHVARCMRLLEILDSSGELLYGVFNSEIAESKEYILPHSRNINWLDVCIFKQLICDFSHIVIDSYKLESVLYETALAQQKEVLIFDDIFASYPDEAFVLNGALSAESKLKDKTNKRRFFGVGYNLASDEFRYTRKVHTKIQNILITLGASDVYNVTQEILNILQSHYADFAIHLHIVIGSFNTHQIHTTLPHTIYHNLDSSAFADLMRRCDIALSAGGQTLYELALSELPTLIYITAPNQTFQAQAFSKTGGMKITNVTNLTTDIQICSYAKRKQMAHILSCLDIGKHKSQINAFISA